MILCDAGPLVALCDQDDLHHQACVTTVNALRSFRLLTTWACFTEAMYLLGRSGGWQAQQVLWRFISGGLLRFHAHAEDETKRMRDLMDQYADSPMDLADASLVAAAETLGERRVFTIDSHFYVYRKRQGEAFEVVP